MLFLLNESVYVVLLVDAMNLCLSLITQGLEDTAFYILKTLPSLMSDNYSTDSPSLGNFFLRHCVNMDIVRGQTKFTHCFPNLVLLHKHRFTNLNFYSISRLETQLAFILRHRCSVC